MGFLKLIAMAAMLLPLASKAQAEDNVDWKAQLKGIEGVGILCIRELEYKYTLRLCNALTERAKERLDEAGIRNAVAPVVFDKRAFIPRPRHFENQLDLTVHVRATKPNPLAIDMRIELSHFFAAAITKDASETPRSGNLVFWTDGWTGAGPRRPLEAAMKKNMLKDLDGVLDKVIENFEK